MNVLFSVLNDYNNRYEEGEEVELRRIVSNGNVSYEVIDVSIQDKTGKIWRNPLTWFSNRKILTDIYEGLETMITDSNSSPSSLCKAYINAYYFITINGLDDNQLKNHILPKIRQKNAAKIQTEPLQSFQIDPPSDSQNYIHRYQH